MLRFSSISLYPEIQKYWMMCSRRAQVFTYMRYFQRLPSEGFAALPALRARADALATPKCNARGR
jgi:hypothetical protein